MVHPVRGVLTLLSVAAAGLLIWLSTHFGESLGDYWIRIGLFAAAGLVLPLGQLFGGWTKWGLPRFSPHVLLLGFLPALVLAGWVIISGQPDDNWFQRHITSWSGDLHVARLVRHLREGHLDVLAFGLGAVFGFSFDTTGPRRPEPPAAAAPPVPAGGAAPIVLPPDAPTVVQPAPEPEAAAETEVIQPPPAEETAVTTVTPPENPPAES